MSHPDIEVDQRCYRALATICMDAGDNKVAARVLKEAEKAGFEPVLDDYEKLILNLIAAGNFSMGIEALKHSCRHEDLAQSLTSSFASSIVGAIDDVDVTAHAEQEGEISTLQLYAKSLRDRFDLPPPRKPSIAARPKPQLAGDDEDRKGSVDSKSSFADVVQTELRRTSVHRLAIPKEVHEKQGEGEESAPSNPFEAFLKKQREKQRDEVTGLSGFNPVKRGIEKINEKAAVEERSKERLAELKMQREKEEQEQEEIRQIKLEIEDTVKRWRNRNEWGGYSRLMQSLSEVVKDEAEVVAIGKTVTRDATMGEGKKAYHKIIRLLHPDKLVERPLRDKILLSCVFDALKSAFDKFRLSDPPAS